VTIEELDGRALDRNMDEKSGLSLWGKNSILV
jgi:hypothetical protein